MLGATAQGQVNAFIQQMNVATVQIVIAVGQVGRFPESSVPDALQRVPGIGVQPDQGEGRFIQIWGRRSDPR